MFVDLCRCKLLLTRVTSKCDVYWRVSTTCYMSVSLYVLLIACTHVLISNISLFVLFRECSDRVGSSDPSSYSLRLQHGRSWNHASVFGDLCRRTSESLLTCVVYWWRVSTCVDNVLHIGASIFYNLVDEITVAICRFLRCEIHVSFDLNVECLDSQCS